MKKLPSTQQFPVNPTLWVVGGFVRDVYLGSRSKDVDFAIEAFSYEEMKQWLVDTYPGINITREDPVYGRLIAGIPSRHLNWTAKEYEVMHGKLPKEIYADFVLSRSEGDYSDGRHPDHVTPANIELDLARRDFTMNAIAVNDATGTVFDPYNGVVHAEQHIITCVGHPHERFTEDVVRLLRLYRFMVTKNMARSPVIVGDVIVNSEQYAELLSKPIFHDRIRDELEKMLRFDTLKTMEVLTKKVPASILDTIFNKVGVWFIPTTKEK